MSSDALNITFGLKSNDGKYLTCESLMGGRINASGLSMKKKQVWSFIPHPTAGDLVFGYFQS